MQSKTQWRAAVVEHYAAGGTRRGKVPRAAPEGPCTASGVDSASTMAPSLHRDEGKQTISLLRARGGPAPIVKKRRTIPSSGERRESYNPQKPRSPDAGRAVPWIGDTRI